MNELDFCTFYCGELTEEQEAVLSHIIKTGRFLGVARCISGMTYMPAYKGYPNGTWHVIDRCGYGQLSAIDGGKLYSLDWHITAYYEQRHESGLGNRNGTTR